MACSRSGSPPASWIALLRDPARFESAAFALTRQAGDVPALHFANLRGEYFGVEATPEGTRIGVRAPAGPAALSG